MFFGIELALTLLVRPQVASWSSALRSFIVLPFYFWHTTLLFLGLGILALWLIRLPVRIGLWLVQKVPAIRTQLNRLRSGTPYRQYSSSRRAFVRSGLAGAAGFALAGTAYGMFVERRNCEVVGVTCRLEGLPESFEGFRIGMISDIHSGPFMPYDFMEDVARQVNALRPDLIVVNGDFVNGSVREVYPLAEAFAALRAPHGVWGVTGNHDYYTGDPATVVREVEACGIRVLQDAWEKIRINNDTIILLGVNDVGRNDVRKVNLDGAASGIPAGAPTVLLCHRPYYFPMAAQKSIGLTLSGHTHGGQVVLGRWGETILAPASLASPYVAGMYAIQKCRMYVNRGIGTVGPPIRFNCPPEITVLSLHRGNPEAPGHHGS
jgi:hypothetical protein